MKARFIAPLFLCCCVSLQSQTPAAAPTTDTQSHKSDLGFAYSLPTDWEVVDASSTLPEVKQQAEQNAATDEDKKGAACVSISLTARHGSPTSVLVVVELPFACLGQTATDKDLPGFAQGASEGLKQSFDLSNPVFGAYALGSHSMWIERAKGTPKGHPEVPYTVEIACSLLKKGAVCWMAMAADDTALKVFEGGAVALEGEPSVALVPSTAFDKKPTS